MYSEFNYGHANMQVWHTWSGVSTFQYRLKKLTCYQWTLLRSCHSSEIRNLDSPSHSILITAALNTNSKIWVSRKPNIIISRDVYESRNISNCRRVPRTLFVTWPVFGRTRLMKKIKMRIFEFFTYVILTSENWIGSMTEKIERKKNGLISYK